MSYQPGQGTACILDSDDPNASLCVEGSALYRVQVGGQWKTTFGEAYYVRVTTGAADEEFHGLAQQSPNRNNRLTALHEGIRRALPDLDEEDNPITIPLDAPTTHVGATNPGRVVEWTNALDANLIIGPVQRGVETDDPTIFIRLG